MDDITYCYTYYVRSLLKKIKPNPVIFCKVVYRFGRVCGSSSLPLPQTPWTTSKLLVSHPLSHSLFPSSPPLLHIIQWWENEGQTKNWWGKGGEGGRKWLESVLRVVLNSNDHTRKGSRVRKVVLTSLVEVWFGSMCVCVGGRGMLLSNASRWLVGFVSIFFSKLLN